MQKFATYWVGAASADAGEKALFKSLGVTIQDIFSAQMVAEGAAGSPLAL
jgi:ornithine cyclodeaminase/alanine dehydrogenase-like protein (mu-crystallin family)